MTPAFKLFIVFGRHRQGKSEKQNNYKSLYGLLRRQPASQEETEVKRPAALLAVLGSPL